MALDQVVFILRAGFGFGIDALADAIGWRCFGIALQKIIAGFEFADHGLSPLGRRTHGQHDRFV